MEKEYLVLYHKDKEYNLHNILSYFGVDARIITVFSEESSLQDILVEEDILAKIKEYYYMDYKESKKCEHIIDYFNNTTIIRIGK